MRQAPLASFSRWKQLAPRRSSWKWTAVQSNGACWGVPEPATPRSSGDGMEMAARWETFDRGAGGGSSSRWARMIGRGGTICCGCCCCCARMDGVLGARVAGPRLAGAANCGMGAAGNPCMANGDSKPPPIMIGEPPNVGAHPPAPQPAPLREGTARRQTIGPRDQRSRESASLRMRVCLRPGLKMPLGRA